MSEEPDQPNPATSIADSEAGHKAANNQHETPHLEANTAFLARAMAHISSPSFVPPVPIEHPESVLLSVTATSEDGPLLVRVATDGDREEPGPLCFLARYPMVRGVVGDVDDPWRGSAELLTVGMVGGPGESVVVGELRDDDGGLGSARVEGMASWIRAQGIEEEDPIVYGDQELSDEWWSKGQGTSGWRNFWAGQLLAAKNNNKDVALNGMGAS
ncbi:hypothetical protein C7212DRAFT_344141 [Tuber magnatum]|uniref:Uncharacterized protein n=1 Tax=Tuber magnatum TaxID=42249 RepID=A0A317ST31_9PEZI|nr:hypothetical protein C7212DRAFT_344141 [Tuber magnatum]